MLGVSTAYTRRWKSPNLFNITTIRHRVTAGLARYRTSSIEDSVKPSHKSLIGILVGIDTPFAFPAALLNAGVCLLRGSAGGH